MNQATLLNPTDTLTLPTADLAVVPLTSPPPLRQSVRELLRHYVMHLDNGLPVNLYEWVLSQVEPPMLEIVLQYAGQNQSSAARLLALSRGTLRKKMQLYGLLPKSKKKRG